MVTNGNGGQLGQARAQLATATAERDAAMAPVQALEAQLTDLQREIVSCEAAAADITSDISAEVDLVARQRRAERMTTEIGRLREAARPAAVALSRAQDHLLQLEHEQAALEATHRMLVDLTQPDVLQLQVAEWLFRLGITRQLLRALIGAAPAATPFDAAAAAHVEQVRRDNERQQQQDEAAIRVRERPRVAVGG